MLDPRSMPRCSSMLSSCCCADSPARQEASGYCCDRVCKLIRLLCWLDRRSRYGGAVEHGLLPGERLRAAKQLVHQSQYWRASLAPGRPCGVLPVCCAVGLALQSAPATLKLWTSAEPLRQQDTIGCGWPIPLQDELSIGLYHMACCKVPHLGSGRLPCSFQFFSKGGSDLWLARGGSSHLFPLRAIVHGDMHQQAHSTTCA